MENNGTSIPARLVLDGEEVMRSCNGAAARKPGKRVLGRQEAHDDEGLVGEVEEEARVDEDLLALHELHDKRVFTARSRHAHDGRPSSFDGKHFTRGVRPCNVPSARQIPRHALLDGVTDC